MSDESRQQQQQLDEHVELSILQLAREQSLRQSVVHLRRLLHRMQHGGNTTSKDDLQLSPSNLLARADLAQDLWQQVVQGFSPVVVVAAAGEEEESPAMRRQKDAYLALQQQVQEACLDAQQQAQKIKAESDHDQVDWVEEIFFRPPKQKEGGASASDNNNTVVHAEREPDGPHTEPENPQHRNTLDLSGITSPSDATLPLNTNRNSTVQELQKAQRQQLEEEISHMASKLKESTQRMNQTLKTQTEELSEMEDLAEHNVDRVGQVADDVTAHNRRQWRNAVATWTMIFVLLGTFAFCFLTIRMVPKRRQTCVLFCKDPEKRWKPPKLWSAIDKKEAVAEDSQPQRGADVHQTLIEHEKRRQERETNIDKGRKEECELDMNGECVVNDFSAPLKDIEQGRKDSSSTAGESIRDDANFFRKDDAPLAQVNADNSLVMGRNVANKEQGQHHEPTKNQVADSVEAADTLEPTRDTLHIESDLEKHTGAVDVGAVVHRDEEDLHNVAATHAASNFAQEDTSASSVDTGQCGLEDIRWAAFHGDRVRLEACLRSGALKAEVNGIDQNGWRPIHEAVAHSRDAAIVQLLIEAGADVNVQTGPNQDGFTPLSLAIDRNGEDHPTVQLLREHDGVEHYPAR